LFNLPILGSLWLLFGVATVYLISTLETCNERTSQAGN